MTVAAALLMAVSIVALAPVGGTAQMSDEARVLDVVQELFHAMEARDAARAARVLLPGGQLISVRPDEEDRQVVAVTPFETFLEQVGAGDEPWLERMWDARVDIHGPIALVWTSYDFYRDSRFSHCGMEAFTLVQVDGGWRIATGTYTVEPTGCPPSPLGPPDE
jgi:hypothetical protein